MKKNYQKLVIFLLSVFILAVALPAQAANGQAYGLIKQQLDDYFTQLEEAKTFSGSVLLAKDGNIIFTKGYGMADIAAGVKNKPGTVLNIGSLSKAFTSMSIMILEERGLLRTTDTVAKYIPEFPNGDKITLHHLLSHSSGLFEYLNNPILWAFCTSYHTPEDLLPYYMDYPLSFEPGSQFEYCNSNYVTLGIIIERITGQSFQDFIDANILTPLKMEHTGYDPLGILFPDMAIGYDLLNPPTVTMDFNDSIAYTAGAINSTVIDLYKWDQALYTEKLVSSASLEKLFTPNLGDYGYAWWINDMEINGEMHNHIWHWGAYFGFHSFISRFVDDDLTVIILANVSGALGTPEDLGPIVSDTAGIVLAGTK